MVLHPVACGAVTTIFGFVLVLLASILAALALLGVRGYWQAGRVSNQYQQAVDRLRQRNLFPGGGPVRDHLITYFTWMGTSAWLTSLPF
jgi:hypothetical protein